MVSITIFVEGGAKGNNTLNTKCRRAFKTLFERLLGPHAQKVKTIPCGPRREAYKDFTRSLPSSNGDHFILLVDSESPVSDSLAKWYHVRNNAADRWDKPNGADESNLFFMAESMESWIAADLEAVSAHFKGQADLKVLQGITDFEKISKRDLLDKLQTATRGCNSGRYDKAKHSYDLLERSNPDTIVRRCPSHAKSLFDTLKEKTGAS